MSHRKIRVPRVSIEPRDPRRSGGTSNGRWDARKIRVVGLAAGIPLLLVAVVGIAVANPGGGGSTVAGCGSPTGSPGTTGSAGTTSTSGTTGTTGVSSTSGTAGSTGSAGATTMSTVSTTSLNVSPAAYSWHRHRRPRPTGTATTTGTATGTATTPAGGTTATSTSPAAGTTPTCATTTSTSAAAGTTTSTSPAAAATPNPNCTLSVPANPLTAQGLATTYQLSATDAAMGPCNEANINQSAFVQATVYDPATGAFSVYEPLVVDKGTAPAVAPTAPTLPAGAVVGIWFGFNGTNLTLQDTNGSLNQGQCVNGLPGSVFGQFAYCGAPAFFAAVNQGIGAGKVTVPPLGTATDGQTCLSTRAFPLIDQDQSDNVQTQYLANGNGQTAQNNAAGKAQLANATVIGNPSDNALLTTFVDPALGCKPWTAPDLANAGAPVSSIALDEIQSNADQAAPVALVPENDPMTLNNGAFSAQKTNLYRAGVDQPALNAGETPMQYCADMDSMQAVRLQQDVNLLIGQTSPQPAAASNLFTFLGMRLNQSFTNLNCQNFGLTNPATLTADGNGVVTAVKFAQFTPAVTPGAGNPGQNAAGTPTGTASPSGGATSPAGTPSSPATPTTGTTTSAPAGNGTVYGNTGTWWRHHHHMWW